MRTSVDLHRADNASNVQAVSPLLCMQRRVVQVPQESLAAIFLLVRCATASPSNSLHTTVALHLQKMRVCIVDVIRASFAESMADLGTDTTPEV